MLDEYGRTIDYLRISLTDRCNFRCLYCMPEEGIPDISHGDILSFEEIIKIATAAAGLGVSKIRLTGGEPLVRKGAVSLVARLKEIPGIKSLSMTTNGYYLEQWAVALKNNGLDRLNISLDTIDPEKFRVLTRRDGLSQVLSGIEAARDVGFSTIKINAVILRGKNDDEILPLVRFARERGLILRFIEQMPFNKTDRKNFVSADEILKILSESLGEPEIIDEKNSLFPKGHGPARMYHFRESGTIVGFITPVTNHFCLGCNRLRITADGKLKPCLLSSLEIDVKTPIRKGCSEGELREILKTAIINKPEKHRLVKKGVESKRGMSKIGG